VDLASAGPLEVKFIITLRRSTPVIEYRRFELRPPGESKLPLSNREYTDFLKILNNKNFYKFLDFLAVCLRVRQSGALRVFVALVRIILDLWAAPPQCGYWGSMGSFCSAPQDFGLLGFFCARFPPREASIYF